MVGGGKGVGKCEHCDLRNRGVLVHLSGARCGHVCCEAHGQHSDMSRFKVQSYSLNLKSLEFIHTFQTRPAVIAGGRAGGVGPDGWRGRYSAPVPAAAGG